MYKFTLTRNDKAVFDPSLKKKKQNLMQKAGTQALPINPGAQGGGENHHQKLRAGRNLGCEQTTLCLLRLLLN